jgi:hypothetical protein
MKKGKKIRRTEGEGYVKERRRVNEEGDVE